MYVNNLKQQGNYYQSFTGSTIYLVRTSGCSINKLKK